MVCLSDLEESTLSLILVLLITCADSGDFKSGPTAKAVLHIFSRSSESEKLFSRLLPLTTAVLP